MMFGEKRIFLVLRLLLLTILVLSFVMAVTAREGGQVPSLRTVQRVQSRDPLPPPPPPRAPPGPGP
ncbi:hypothetical protein AAG906_014099 [Vitis piasezkii]